MHWSGHDERLAATDFHVARGIHRKLEDGNAGQLKLLIHAGVDILHAGRVLRMRHHGVSRNISVQAGINWIQWRKAPRSGIALHKGLTNIAVAVVKYPGAP